MADVAGPWTQYQGASSAPAVGPWAAYQGNGAPADKGAELGIGAAGGTEDKGSFSKALLHGATAGLSDEIFSGLTAPVQYGLDSLTGKKPADASLGDYYQADLNNIRGGLQKYGQEHPVLNALGEAAGGLMDFNPEAATASIAKGFWPMVRQGAVTGAALGGASGFGNAEGGAGNRFKGALIGAGAGTVVGGAAPVVVPWSIGGVSKAANMISKAVAPWSNGLDDFIDITAGHVLNDAAGRDGAEFEETPLEGMKLTAGQASNNPGLKWLERSVEQSGPEAAGASAEARTGNNQAIRSAIGKVGDLTADAPQAMSDAVEKAANAAKTSTRSAWKAAGVDETTGISAPQLQDHITDYMDGLTVAARKNIPDDILDTVKQLADGGTTNLGEIQDLRSNVLGATRMAARSGDDNKARILGGVADTISDFIDNIPRPEEAAEAYDTARAATKQMKQTFNQPAAVRNVLGVDRYGADKTPLSAVADTYIRSGKGAPEAFQSYLDAVDSQSKNAGRPGQTAVERIQAARVAQDDVEAGYQAARDAFAQRFLDHVETTATDQAGSKIVSAAKVSNFLNDHSHIIDSKIFDDGQRDMIRRIGQAADMANRTAMAGAKGGSDTYAKLQGKTFLDALIGPGASKLVPLAGAALGAHAGVVGGPLGSAGGALAGAGAAMVGENKLTNLLYGATRDKAIALVHEAMSNPALADTLMKKASAQAAIQIPRPQRRLIYTILGSEGAAHLAGALSGTQGQNNPTP